MDGASEALFRRDYASCERACWRALSAAYRNEDWPRFARILMPLQEARRQRRIIAAEGTLRLGTRDLTGDVADGLDHAEAAWWVVTPPHTIADAGRLLRTARDRDRPVVVMFAERGGIASSAEGAADESGNTSAEVSGDMPTGTGRWVFRSLTHPTLTHLAAAPPEAWCDRWLAPEQARSLSLPRHESVHPPDWLQDRAERLGDAALDAVTHPVGSRDRVEALLEHLEAAPDHELLHQHLEAAARALALARPDSAGT